MNTLLQGRILSPKNQQPANLPNNKPSDLRSRYGEKASLTALLKDCFISLFQKPPKATVIICALALTLPAAIALFSTGFKTAEANLLDSRHITVFLSSISNRDAELLASTLASNSHIQSAEVSTVDLQVREILTIDIQPATTLQQTQLDAVIAELNSHTAVDFVAADPAWLERNIEAISTAKKLRWVSIAAAALVTAVLAYVLTTTDLNRQKSELRVLQQIGASRSMMLKPLILRCMLLTLLASTIGIMLSWGIIANLPRLDAMSTYQQLLPHSFPATRALFLIAFAIFSSYLTVRILKRSI